MTKRLIAVGERLKVARSEQGLNLRELASRAGVSASLLSQIESGKVTPSSASLFQIANALELPIHAFFPQTGEETGIISQPEPESQPPAPIHSNVREKQLTYAAMESRSLRL